MSTIENALFYINHIVKFFSYFASISIKELGDWLRFAWQSPSQIFWGVGAQPDTVQPAIAECILTPLQALQTAFCSLFRFLK